MITGIDINKIVEYILKGDTDNPTIWKLGMIPGIVMGDIGASAQSDKERVACLYKVLQFGIKGWSNYSIPYKTETIKVGEKNYDVASIEAIMSLPLNVVAELSEKIFEINNLTEGDRKN